MIVKRKQIIPMKLNILLSFFLLANISLVFSQELPNLKHIKLHKKSHYKDVEPVVIKVTDYLFATQIDTKNDSRRAAAQFLMKWMDGTPYEVFLLGDKQTHFFNTDTELMLIYMAGLAKFSLENKGIKDQDEKVIGTLQLVLPYLDKQNTKETWSKELWQLMDAYQKGKLKEFIHQ